MKLLGIIVLMTLLIMPCVAYQNHGIVFDIPENWSLVNDQWDNRTQSDGALIFPKTHHLNESWVSGCLNGTLMTDAKMELTDNQSTIRIDVMNLPQGGGHFDTCWAEDGYNQGFANFYELAALKNRELMNGSSHGTSYNGYTFLVYYENEDIADKNFENRTKGKPEDFNEWVLVKPLNGKLVGLYGNFNSPYEFQEIGMMKYPMPQPLYDIANSLRSI